MATVLGEVKLVFADDTLVRYSVERAATVLDSPGTVWSIGFDVPALVDLYGPIESLTYTATVVPLPPALWLMLGALAWLAMRAGRD